MLLSTKYSSTLMMSSVLASSMFLVACGGGSSSESNSSTTDPTTPTNPTTPTDPTTPTNPTTPTDPTTPTNPTILTNPQNSDLLIETSTLPSLPVNNFPLDSTGDLASLDALKEGVYTTSMVTIISIGGNTAIDCPSGGSVACPSINKYQLDNNGSIIVSSWAYMPNSKKWIELSASGGAFNNVFILGNTFSDGGQWSNTALNFSKISGTQVNNSINFTYGDTGVTVSGITKNMAPASSSIMAGVTYSNNAQTINYLAALSKGQYISLDESGFWKKTDDGNTYTSIAKYRAAHTIKDNPICFKAQSWDVGLVFNATQTGATQYKIGGGCENKVDVSSSVINLAEGIKTIANKQIIYIGQNPNLTSIGNNTSESQFLWAFALSSKNIPAQGRAYQAGYVGKVNAEFYNKAALLEWLIAKQGYNASLALPN